MRAVLDAPSDSPPQPTGEVFRVWLPGPLALKVREAAAGYDGIGPMLRHIVREWLRERA